MQHPLTRVFTFVAATLAVALVFGGLSAVGVLAPVDAAVYHLLHSARPPAAGQPAAVLLVECEPANITPSDAARLAATLRDLGATAVAFTDPALRRAAEHLSDPSHASEFPPLAVAVARQVSPDVAEPKAGDRIGYRGGPDSLPRVRAAAALGGELVPELVRGKAVLIGRPADDITPTLPTPVSRDRGMTVLEHHGQAANSLLTGTRVGTPSGWPQVALFGTAVLVSAVLVRLISGRRVVWALLAELVVTGAGVAGLFVIGSTWVPSAGLLGAQVACGLLALHAKAAAASAAVGQLSRDLTAATRDRPLPVPFTDALDPWELLAGMVRQTLDVRRMVFLDVTGRRGDVAALFGTEVADIVERRRDLTREPYSTAVRSGRPVRLDPATRPFFTPTTDVQFLVPLAFAGRVLGVWVVTTDPAAAERTEDVLDGYARQFGELLHRRRVRQAASDPTRGGGGVYDRLGVRLRSFVERLDRAEQAFAEGVNPAASFDLFGRSREVNEAMRERLRAGGHDPALGRMTAADLIAALTGRDVTFARRCVRQVSHDHRDLALPTDAADAREHLLRVFPLADAAVGSGTLDGIGLELIDQTALVRLRKLKDQLAGRVGVLLRNDLASVELSVSLLTADADGEAAQIGQLVHEKIAAIVRTLDAAEGYHLTEPSDGGTRLPLDPHAHCVAAVADAEADARTRGVTIAVTRPPVLGFALADPDALRRLFGQSLNLLLRDARAGSELRVEVAESAEAICYTLQNAGFGLPADRLRGYLGGDAEPADPDLRPLWHTAREAGRWGARVVSDSTPGDGILLRLSLQRFN